MIKSLPLAFMSLLALSYASGQSVSTLSGAQAQGLGFASSCLFNEWAILNNAAGMARIVQPAAAVTYAISSFLPDGNIQGLTFNYPAGPVVCGIGIFSFGDHEYNEKIISTGIATEFGLASLGLKLNYIRYQASGYGQKGVFTASLGGIAALTPMFSIGAHIININQPVLSKQDNERVPTTLVLGIRFDLSDHLLVTSEIQKQIAFDPVFRIGIAYSPHEKIIFRSGVNLNPDAVFVGIGFRHKKLLLDYAFEYRVESGTSNQGSLGFQFSGK